MSLQYPPTPGTIVICNYDRGFKEPEMVKRRLAVVVSPRLPKRDWLCTVVPLSTTPSPSGLRYQCKVTLPQSPPEPYPGTIKWAKADMLATVAYGCGGRLTLPFEGRELHGGKRKYLKIILDQDELRKIQRSILHALGFDSLTEHV